MPALEKQKPAELQQVPVFMVEAGEDVTVESLPM